MDLPCAIGEVRELVEALGVGDGGELLRALGDCHRYTRHGQAAEDDVPVDLRR